MSLANADITKQKIQFSRKDTSANRPDKVLERKQFISGDNNPNDKDLTAGETDKKIHYTLPNGKNVEIDSRHAVKDKTGTITGLTSEAANKLEMDIAKAKTPETKKDERKSDIIFARKKKNALIFKTKSDKKLAANIASGPNAKQIGLG